MIMMMLLKYWKILAAAALVAGVLAWGGTSLYKAGAAKEELVCAQGKLAAQIAHDKAMAAEQERTSAANEALRAELAKPRFGPRIREIVRNNPSTGEVSQAVVDAINERIRGFNEGPGS